MYLDKELIFSDNAAVTSTSDSEVVDLGRGGDAIGQELTLHVVVAKAYGGAGTLTITLKTGDTSVPADVVLSTGAFTGTAMTEGRELFCVRLPQGLKRYARLSYTVASSITGGKISAFISREL